MPNDSKSDQPQIDEDVLRNLLLLTLPWLSFQRDVLELAKKCVTDAGNVKSTENFALRQFQALMMILDRSRTLRNSVDSDFEKKVEDAYKEIFPKVSSASVQLIEAQEAVLDTVFDAFKILRKAEQAKKRSKDDK
jgi:hypothetical protein